MPNDKHPERLYTPNILKTNNETNYLFSTMRHWPFEYESIKQSQWMVLSWDFIHELIINQAARLLLGFCEHSIIPDEMFFLTFAKSPAGIKLKVLEAEVTYFHFTWSNPHPDTLTLEQISQIRNDSLLFFARKVDFNDEEVRRYADLERSKYDNYLGIT